MILWEMGVNPLTNGTLWFHSPFPASFRVKDRFWSVTKVVNRVECGSWNSNVKLYLSKVDENETFISTIHLHKYWRGFRLHGWLRKVYIPHGLCIYDAYLLDVLPIHYRGQVRNGHFLNWITPMWFDTFMREKWIIITSYFYFLFLYNNSWTSVEMDGVVR